MSTATAESGYLDFIRSRPCTLCGNPRTEPHHAIRRLPGISEAGLAQKCSDFLCIPLCNPCHRNLHRGVITLSRTGVLEFCLINLICFLEATYPPQQHGEIVPAACRKSDEQAQAGGQTNPSLNRLSGVNARDECP
jgi:hypothetical protein